MCSQLICQTCIQLSASFRTSEMVVDLKVASLVAAGCKQQVLSPHSSSSQQ